MTCLLAATSAACGGYFAADLSRSLGDRGVLAMLCMAGVMGTANAVNDIVDLPADRVSKPRRPLSSGRISVRIAWCLVFALITLTVLTAAISGIVELVFATLLLCLAFTYSYLFKNTVLVGNLVVGVVCCGTLLFGSLTFGKMTPSSFVAAGVILLYVVAYEVVKTLQDREPDAVAGLRTLATTYDPEVSVAAYAAVAAVLVVVALGVGPLVSPHPTLYLALALPCLIAPVCSCAYLLFSWRDWNRSTTRSLLILRLAWFPGLLSLLSLK
jgi:geranylgeranylglycerol-phosphate geranylgeranyltransferase